MVREAGDERNCGPAPMDGAQMESVLYDYYNPEARATIKPIRFLIQ